MIRFKRKYRGFGLALALGLCIVMAGGTVARAEDQKGGMPGDWLSLYGSARSMGVGGAFVAVADEPLGVVWNPAGFSQMYQNAIHLETVRLFEETSIDCFSFAMPGRRIPDFGFTVLSLRSGDFERTNNLNESLGTFNNGEMAFLFSVAKRLSPRLSVGANAKVVRQSIDVFNASGVGADFGVLYSVTRSVRLGASVLNVGGPKLTLRSSEESYLEELRGGVSVSVLNGRGLVTAEVDHRSGPGSTLHAGCEYWVHPTLALRLGSYDMAPAGGFSCRLAPNMRFDYGMSNHELGVTHRIGFSYHFGGFFAHSKADPPVFSPIGQQSVTRFDLKAKTKADISKWRLRIVDKSDQVVRSFSGSGAPPAYVMWDGKSEAGLSLPDGRYEYWLVVLDEEGREITGHSRTVAISTAGPQGAAPVVIK
jgi:hypothetical protein